MHTTNSSVVKQVEFQLRNFFPIGGDVNIGKEVAELAFKKTVVCIESIKGWGEAGFDCIVSWQYSTYLYFLSREIWIHSRDEVLATKIFLLNKALNAVELHFRVELPNFFFLGHTVGLVFAQATYSNFCLFHQSCTVGRSGEDRPILEEGVILYPNASVIGRCYVRENTVLAPGVQLVNQDTPGNCYVFTGEKGRPVFKEIDEYFADRYFDRQVALVAAKA